MDAAFGLGEAAPAAVACTGAGDRAVGAGHAADRSEAQGLQRMAWQPRRGEGEIELGAGKAGERIEFEPRPVGLNGRQVSALAAMLAFAAAQPAVESGKLPGQRFDLTDAAAGVAIAKAQIAVGSRSAKALGDGVTVRTSVSLSRSTSASR